ncbi:iron-sulfur cluster assembly scaffold protein, partial [uncultured Catenibacterium sp.]|uniref:iron-sulfur cluster assembly scaffold protein n=1 Tax=uncultured Catenibacterium sp. TaxID=286142 RepID=UPI0025F0B681
MIYSKEVEEMYCVKQGGNHGCAPIPEEGKWVYSKEIKDISAYTHGIGWCAPQQGACKLSLNVKEGIIEEALIETIGCSGMTHSAAMASEILPGLTILEALNTDLVCDAINTAMRELFLQIVYGRSQSAFSEDGLVVGAGLEDLGKGLRSQVGTMYGTLAKGPRYLEMTDGYVTGVALDEDDEIIGYKFINFGKMMDFIKAGDDANTAFEKAQGQYGR